MSDAAGGTRSETPRTRRESSARRHAWLFHVFSCHAPTVPTLAACQLDELDEVAIGRIDSRAQGRLADDRRMQLCFPDPWMSSRHARIERGAGGFWVKDEDSKNGLLVNGEQTDGGLLADGDWIEAGRTLLRYRYGALPPSEQPRTPRCGGVGPLLTALPDLEERSRELEEIARSMEPVMLRGDTGTGKEVVARAIHRISGRPGELIAVNCGGLPESLVEAQLFGHRKGGFTGAVADHPGFVRAADRGTLFLDEIGDLPLAFQAAFLRVLQEREVTPVGDTRPIKVDFRVICATHRDLEAQVELGQFRADLYARLSGYRFSLPPLRERREDLGLLIAALLQRTVPGRDVQFEPEAARALCRHDWPHNVRELERCLASAVVRARGAAIALEHLSITAAASGAHGALPGADPAKAASRADSSPPAGSPAPARPRREQLESLLRTHRGNVTAVARALGKARSQIQRWLHYYELDPAHYRDP